MAASTFSLKIWKSQQSNCKRHFCHDMPCLQKQLAKQRRKAPVITFHRPLWLETPSIASLICQMIATALHGALHGAAQAKSSPWIRKTPKASYLLRGKLNQCNPAGHIMHVQLLWNHSHSAAAPENPCQFDEQTITIYNKLPWALNIPCWRLFWGAKAELGRLSESKPSRAYKHCRCKAPAKKSAIKVQGRTSKQRHAKHEYHDRTGIVWNPTHAMEPRGKWCHVVSNKLVSRWFNLVLKDRLDTFFFLQTWHKVLQGRGRDFGMRSSRSLPLM